jgi:hypothetical protein
MKGFAKRAVLRLSAKELRTELYWAPPFTACRATKGFYGETTKRATEVSVFSRQRSRERLMGLGVQCDLNWPSFMFSAGGLGHRVRWWYFLKAIIRYRQGQSTSPTEHKVKCRNMGTLVDRPSLGSSSTPRKTGHGQLRGRSLRTSLSTGKPCTWRRQAGNRWGL